MVYLLGRKLIVVPGPSSRNLGFKVAEILGVNIVNLSIKFFPDGETYIKFEGEVEGETVVLIQSLNPPQDTHLLQLFLMADTAKDLGAKRVVAVVPYTAYARQDKRFLPGEAISINTIIKLIEASGVDRFVTFNIHEENILNRFRVKAESISAMRLLAEYFLKEGMANAFALAPDQGALRWAKEANEILKGGYGWLKKERDRITGEISVEEKTLDIKDRTVIIFDDIISTGGTVAAACKIAKSQGAKKVYAACVHPLLVGNAYERIMNSGCDGIIGTDTIPSRVSKVSVASLIAEVLRDELSG